MFLIAESILPSATRISFHISFLNHFPNLNLVNDRGTVGMKYFLTKN
mgnify:CR=1 FL=1|jgi:hypothetical protein